MNVTIDQIKDRIEQTLVEAGLVRSRWVWTLYGRDTDQLLPESFAVGVPLSDIEDFDGRDYGPDNGEARSRVSVLVASRLRGDNQSEDVSAALRHEHDVLRWVMTGTRSGWTIAPASVSRDVRPGGEWMVSTLSFIVHHRIDFV